VKVLGLRKRLDFKALLCGKISLDDLQREQIYTILNFEGMLLPPFMEDMEEYHRCLDEIAKWNHIESIEEEELTKDLINIDRIIQMANDEEDER